MKKILFLALFTLASLVVPFQATAAIAVTDATTIMAAQSLQIEQKEGLKKGSLKEKVAMRYFKKMMNKQQQQMEDIAAGRRGFNIFAFLVGFIFSWIGVLIIWLVGGNTRSALIGALISLLLWILLIAA